MWHFLRGKKVWHAQFKHLVSTTRTPNAIIHAQLYLMQVCVRCEGWHETFIYQKYSIWLGPLDMQPWKLIKCFLFHLIWISYALLCSSNQNHPCGKFSTRILVSKIAPRHFQHSNSFACISSISCSHTVCLVVLSPCSSVDVATYFYENP